jgi:hypothetical protein
MFLKEIFVEKKMVFVVVDIREETEMVEMMEEIMEIMV